MAESVVEVVDRNVEPAPPIVALVPPLVAPVDPLAARVAALVATGFDDDSELS